MTVIVSDREPAGDAGIEAVEAGEEMAGLL
jgi:hypothetical protein